jgi:choline-glycine betaine transporter
VNGSAMIIGALPFTMVMGLMMLSLSKALYRDSARSKGAEGSSTAAE